MVSEIREISKIETVLVFVNIENVLMIQYSLYQSLCQNITHYSKRVIIPGFYFYFQLLFSADFQLFYIKTDSTISTKPILRDYIL